MNAAKSLEVLALDFVHATSTGEDMADPNADYIFFEHDAPRVHQGDIILRQLARMLLGLPSLTVDDMAPLLASPKALAFAVAQPQRL